MILKHSVFSTHQRLKERYNASFKRAHLYELIAASFGCKSYAAFSASMIVIKSDCIGQRPQLNERLVSRIIALGYDETLATSIAKTCSDEFLQQDLSCINLVALFESLLSKETESHDRETFIDEDRYDDMDDEPLIAEFDTEPERFCVDVLKQSVAVVHSLEVMANKGNVQAHYVLAVLHRCKKPGSFLYQQAQKGIHLTALQKQRVDDYIRIMPIYEKYNEHLRLAAEGGVRQAALELSINLGSHDYYHMANNGNGPVNALLMAEMAPSDEIQDKWLIVAARDGSDDALSELYSRDHGWAVHQMALKGDLYAIRELALDAIQTDMVEAWVWQYYAQRHNEDLTSSTLRAYHDGGSYDGQVYDDDMGGALYVDGNEAIQLFPLTAEQDKQARLRANALYKKYRDQLHTVKN